MLFERETQFESSIGQGQPSPCYIRRVSIAEDGPEHPGAVKSAGRSPLVAPNVSISFHRHNAAATASASAAITA